MAAICRFCSREFVSGQAVRAHLRACDAYRDRRAHADLRATRPGERKARQPSLEDASLGNLSTTKNIGDFVSDYFGDRHPEPVGRRARPRPEPYETPATDERPRPTSRRDIIQAVKREVIDLWPRAPFVGTDLKVQIRAAIEQNLAGLSVEELPHRELVEAATSIRDRLHGQSEAVRRATELDAAGCIERRKDLIQNGTDYAERALQETDGLKGLDRLIIASHVRTELEQEIKGDEANDEIEEFVDRILEGEGIEFDDEEW